MDQPEAYGRKSDIWSLACTLVQMINEKKQNKAVQMRKINLVMPIILGKALTSRIEKLSNGIQKQQNKDMGVRKLILD
uniref:Protein kinase domain-containing protein n=1 Tax=Plectus sambesii TaxID=2011161 RepID=A0A914VPQ9_9BILA